MLPKNQKGLAIGTFPFVLIFLRLRDFEFVVISTRQTRFHRMPIEVRGQAPGALEMDYGSWGFEPTLTA
jgi:hypothetical protein